MGGFLELFSGVIFWRGRGKGRMRRGERVRILPYEKIRERLDGRGGCEGLMFMDSMVGFCGGEYEVLKEVKWVYDESSMKMLKCEDIVVLKGLICDGKGMLDGRDCDRSCPYFWKKAWLERV